MQEKQKVVSVIADPIPEEVRKHIEATARAMIGHSNLTQDDFQDICQENLYGSIKGYLRLQSGNLQLLHLCPGCY